MMDAAIIILPVTIAVLSLIWNVWYSRKTLGLTERRDFVSELRARIESLEKELADVLKRLGLCEREGTRKNERIIELLMELKGRT